jgi:hypothetical protein
VWFSAAECEVAKADVARRCAPTRMQCNDENGAESVERGFVEGVGVDEVLEFSNRGRHHA